MSQLFTKSLSRYRRYLCNTSSNLDLVTITRGYKINEQQFGIVKGLLKDYTYTFQKYTTMIYYDTTGLQ